MALGRFPQRYFPRACLSFTVIPGTSKADVSVEGLRFLDSREIVGPIPVMISELMVALRRNVRVSSKVEGAFRIDRPEYPETAVREAVANALMHRDYSPDGCASQVQVTMYDDRIEILSPGGLCRAMTVDRLGELGVSFPRNQALANILRATPYAEGFAEVGSVVENKGTGYFQIRASLREANMPEPVAIDHITAFEVALYKAGAGAEAGRFGFGLGERAGGGGRGGVRLPEGAAGGKIVRSVTEWSDETGRFHTIHVLAPGTVECDIVDFLEEAPAPVSSRILMDALGKSKATISRAQSADGQVSCGTAGAVARPGRRLSVGSVGALQRREERFVEAVVVVKFGVEGAGDLVVVAHGHRCVVQGDEGLDVRTEGFDARGANKGERNSFIFPATLGVEAAELAAVGVAAHGDGQGAEMVGEQDEAGAGAEGGEALGDALAQRFEHSQVMQQLRLYGGLAAGEHQAVEGTGEVGGLA